MTARHVIIASVCFVLFAFLLVGGQAFATGGNAPVGGGGSCGGQAEADGTQGQQQAYNDGLYTCTGISWVPEAFIVGGVTQANAAPSCNSTNAGMVEYTGGILEYCNGTSFLPISSGPGPGVLISTQTASSSASLQFSGSNWSSSYNTLFLNCNGLTVTGSPSTGAYVQMFVGEGATPTWKTTTNYTTVYIEGGSSVSGGSSTATTMWTADSGETSPNPVGFKMYLDNVSSSSLYKMATITQTEGTDAGGNPHIYIAESYWNSDTNPVTGLELVAEGTGAAFSGTCSLYGMN
jgi:hypothetical protein